MEDTRIPWERDADWDDWVWVPECFPNGMPVDAILEWASVAVRKIVPNVEGVRVSPAIDGRKTHLQIFGLDEEGKNKIEQNFFTVAKSRRAEAPPREPSTDEIPVYRPEEDPQE